MDTTDTAEIVDVVDNNPSVTEADAKVVSTEVANETQTSNPSFTVTLQSSSSSVPMYKTERGFNINVVALARDASADIQRVRVIGVPAPVKTHRIGKTEMEAPTLSEVGGGTKNNFCQVIAGKDGRSVSVDDIHYINTDPARSNINHGTASVGIGNYFSIGWAMKADLVILIYEIVGMEEYIPPLLPTLNNTRQVPEQSRPVAKLTCNLVGYELYDWRRHYLDVPEPLMALLEVTRDRLRNDTDIPFYLDMFRMTKPIEELKELANDIIGSEENFEYREQDHNFMINVMREIQDIRTAQYEMLPVGAAAAKRKVDTLRLIETLTLDPDGHYIDVTLTPIRADIENTTFRLRLTRQNFASESGRMLLERGMTLTHTSFDRLKMDLEGRKDKVVVVYLTSLR